MAVKVIGVVVSCNAAYDLCTLRNRKLNRIRVCLARSPITFTALVKQLADIADLQGRLVLDTLLKSVRKLWSAVQRTVPATMCVLRTGATRASLCVVRSLSFPWIRLLRLFVVAGAMLERDPVLQPVAVDVPDIPAQESWNDRLVRDLTANLSSYRTGPGDRRNWMMGVDYWSQRAVSAGRST